MREYKQINPKAEVILRLRPFIPGLSDRDDEHLHLMELAKEAGAEAVTTEFFCLEARVSNIAANRYAQMSQVLGYDLMEFYKRNSHGSGYLRLNYAYKAPVLKRMKEHAHKLGLRFYVSDAHHKQLCDNTNCCGHSPEMPYNKGQFTEALLLAKVNGRVRWRDIEPFVAHLKHIPYKKAFGFNTKGSVERVIRHRQNMYDYVQEFWNTPNSAKSPYRYFSGVLKPEGLDEDGNVVYIYDHERAAISE